MNILMKLKRDYELAQMQCDDDLMEKAELKLLEEFDIYWHESGAAEELDGEYRYEAMYEDWFEAIS